MNKALMAVCFGGLSLLAVSVSLCGIGLSLGIRKLSIVSFFSAVVLLVMLRLAGRALASRSRERP